jgi:hypothetical protein
MSISQLASQQQGTYPLGARFQSVILYLIQSLWLPYT